MQRLLLLVTCLILVNTGLEAQFILSGEFRPRMEYSHGYKDLAFPDQKASLFTSQRTRLNLFYENEMIKTGLVIQDVRTWGAQKQLVDNNINSFANAEELNSTAIHQAWLDLYFIPEFSLKAGRQELVYDDHRILGNVGWAQQARTHDVALFKYENDFKIHLGIAYNQNTNRTNNFYGQNDYKAMQYIWANTKTDKYNISLLFLNNGLEQEILDDAGNITEVKTNYSQTLGTHSYFKTDMIKAAFNLYYQGGKTRSEMDVSALNIGIDISAKVSKAFTAVGGYEFLSGNSQLEAKEKEKAFAPLYGTNHKFNGFMDYFYVGNHGGSVGLQDIYLKGKFKTNNWSGGGDIHFFMSAADIADPVNAGDALGSYLGTEVDLYVGYSFKKNINIKAGYSHMLATESMEAIKSGGSKDETNNWAYIMITVKPTFFKSDN